MAFHLLHHLPLRQNFSSSGGAATPPAIRFCKSLPPLCSWTDRMQISPPNIRLVHCELSRLTVSLLSDGLAYSNYTYVSELMYCALMSYWCQNATCYCTINGFNKLYNDIDTSCWTIETCTWVAFYYILRQSRNKYDKKKSLCENMWVYITVNIKKKPSAASREVNLRLYIPCRTECVWSCLSHRLGSRGVYGRWLTIYQTPRERNEKLKTVNTAFALFYILCFILYVL